MADHNLSAANSTQLNLTVSGTARTRVNLALHHLFAACRFAANVREIEAANAGAQFGGFWDEILHNSLGTVTMSVAALECYANEFYVDGQAQGPHVNAESALLLAELIDRQKVLDKYKFSLAIRSAKRLNLGSDVVQRVDTLIKLRNSIVHYQPEWFDEREKHEKLTQQLGSRFGKSPFLPNEPMFPMAWASAACATWALSSVVGFIDYFCVESGIANPLALFRGKLTECSRGAL